MGKKEEQCQYSIGCTDCITDGHPEACVSKINGRELSGSVPACHEEVRHFIAFYNGKISEADLIERIQQQQI